MLPIGANAETCYQQQDAWTLALFSASLLLDCGKNSLELVPNAVLDRLKIFLALYKEWESFLSGKADADNILAAIIKQAEDSLMGKSSRIPDSNHDQPICPIQTSDESEAKDIVNNSTTNEIVSDESCLEQFITWIKRGLSIRKLSINQHDSLVHRVSKGLFLIIPELWQRFISQNAALEMSSDSVSWQSIFDDSYFIRSDNGDFEHCYCLGPWENGDAIQGVILKLPLLFFPNQIPPINKELTSNPLDDSDEVAI